MLGNEKFYLSCRLNIDYLNHSLHILLSPDLNDAQSTNAQQNHQVISKPTALRAFTKSIVKFHKGPVKLSLARNEPLTRIY